mgnify:FL=1
MKGVYPQMKIICKKTDLSKGINIVSKAVPTKTTMPILECILIDASAEGIRFTANDMELGIETFVEGQVEEAGLVAIDARIFGEIVRKLPDNDVTISMISGNQVQIVCENANFTIHVKSGEEFSGLPDVEKVQSIQISQFTLKEMIKQTIFSISDNDSNAMMTGELFEIKDQLFKIVSLDGHRISIRNVELKEQYEPIRVIVPGKTLNDLTKILSGEMEEIVTIYFSKNHLLFEFEHTRVVSRIIEGEYFKIDQMLSNDYQTKIHINKRELLDCIDRSTLLIKEGDKKPIVMDIKDHVMELKMQSFIGSMDEEIQIQKEGKDIMIAFNPKFLIEALRVIDDEEIDIYMMNPKAPCIIKDSDHQMESYVYLILPVNFNVANQH